MTFIIGVAAGLLVSILVSSVRDYFSPTEKEIREIRKAVLNIQKNLGEFMKAEGHEFELKPYTVLKAGHWCADCLPPPWNYDEQAKKNPFFAQVWYPNHDNNENNFYPNDCYKDIVD